MIPLSIPNFEGNELKYVTDAVGQGWVSTGGAYITEMEKKMAEFIEVPRAVACQSGTAALHLSLIECGVQAGDLVIAPTLTFIAAVNPIKYLGAEPVFMDCDDSLCMDPDKLEDFCENECELLESETIGNKVLIHKASGKKIPALVVVHVFGNMADMERIMDIASRYSLKVVEDATEALGTKYVNGRYEGRYAGTIGDFGAYSFNGNKIITTGGGGMVTAKDQDVLAHIAYLSTQSKDDPHFYIHNEVGYNYRMTNVQAAIGVAQLECLNEFIERKNKNYDKYKEYFDSCQNIILMPFREGTRSNKWFYALNIEKSGIDMHELVHTLDSRQVQTRLIWGLIHEQKPYRDSIAYRIEKANKYSKCVLNIPCSTNITTEDITTVCETVNSVVESFA